MVISISLLTKSKGCEDNYVCLFDKEYPDKKSSVLALVILLPTTSIYVEKPSSLFSISSINAINDDQFSQSNNDLRYNDEKESCMHTCPWGC